MGKIPLSIDAHLPEEARLIALCLYAGLMRFPNADDEGLAKIFFRVSNGAFHEALLALVGRTKMVPPAMTATLQSNSGLKYTEELLRCLTETLLLARFSSDGASIRLLMTEEVGYKLVDHLGISDSEAFEYVRDLGKVLVELLPRCKAESA
ncbi:MAG: hypothetical protein AAB563_02070 [Patescibacteria group bacterium]